MMYLLHILALFTFPPALFITIPLHMIIYNQEQKRSDQAIKDMQIVFKKMQETLDKN